jgi:hypothetical protein
LSFQPAGLMVTQSTRAFLKLGHVRRPIAIAGGLDRSALHPAGLRWWSIKAAEPPKSFDNEARFWFVLLILEHACP